MANQEGLGILSLLDPRNYKSGKSNAFFKDLAQGVTKLVKDKAVSTYKGMDTMDKAALATSPIPVVGDLVGLANDARYLAKEPTMANAAMMGIGALPFVPSLGMVKAYHGSPHKFDKFDISKIGTGEGAQAYGHGLYFAESPDVAKTYQPRSFKAEDQMLKQYKSAEKVNDYEAMEIWEVAMMHSTPDEIVRRYSTSEYSDQMKAKAQKIAAQLNKMPTEGGLYNVELDVNHEDLLDWDAPLSEQPKLKEFIFGDRVMPDGSKAPLNMYDKMKGAEAYYMLSERLGGDAKASAKLKELGIPGIRYLDSGNRSSASTEGTRNLVIFDDSLVKIAGKK